MELIKFTATSKADGGRISIMIRLSRLALDFVLLFRNKYAHTARLSCRYGDQWVLQVPCLVLMPHPHYEDGSQDEFKISSNSV